MTNNCLLCGVGGQGTVLASKLIAFAAMEKSQNVRTAETIGMAQRGGCVVSHTRIGDVIHSPLIPKGDADILIGFEPGEALRCLPYLKKDGVAVVNTKAVQPVTASLSGGSYCGEDMLTALKAKVKELILIDGEEICNQCGSPKVLNLALLGAAAASGRLGITVEELEEAIRKRIPPKFQEMNLKAVTLAAETIR
ncbi:MAG: indolepyruvate oxidoreductase subunit beta [Bacillota bacterium]|nr:indolepyruvate oxidoreductase subunit beta [Bacillota bacterium]